MQSVPALLLEAASGLWVELSFLLFFLLGFAVLRLDLASKFGSLLQKSPQKSQKKASKKISEVEQNPACKAIHAEFTAGNQAGVLSEWHAALKATGPVPADILKLVAAAAVEKDQFGIFDEIICHMQSNLQSLGKHTTINTVLDVLARSGNIGQMEGFFERVQKVAGVKANYQSYEILLGGYATAGDLDKVKDVVAYLISIKQKLTARGYSLIIKGFLKNGMAEAALFYVTEMRRQGFYVPAFAVTQLFRVAVEKGCVEKVLDETQNDILFPAECIALILEDCCKNENMDVLKRVEHLAQQTSVPLLYHSYDALVKMYARAGDAKAFDLFEQFQASFTITEGSCVGILARCALSRSLKLADKVVGYARANMQMTIALYSALMKVYAYSSMYDKACDIYDMVRADGLEPDPMMYGCLMKFAVECDRTELSQELFRKTPQAEIQNYMSLIRSAGRSKDVNRAFEILEDLKKSNISLDIAAYNCVLDVCVICGDMKRAEALCDDMRKISKLDMITYNTLLKGYCGQGDLQGARKLLREMESLGHKPNDVSFNCMINAAVKAGNMRDAWDIVASMEKSGIPVDHYTVSTMMKAMKNAKHPRDVQKALELLDRSGLNVCGDEVLLNTVLDTCIRQKENVRLQQVLDEFSRSDLKPSVPTYGSLIKAHGALKQVQRCRDLWNEMMDTRSIEPNEITCGCMMDALVCNKLVEEALEVLHEWKKTKPANTIMYSCLIKGFTNQNMMHRTLDLFNEMRADGITPNSVTYNALIDAQARIGAMEKVQMLLEQMETDQVKLDSVTYSTIIKGFCVNGDLDQALEVFLGMQEHNTAGDAVIFNTLLDGCCRHGKFEFADRLIDNMQKYNIVPSNFTLTILVKMWGRRKQLNKAFDVVEKLPSQYGFQANCQVYSCVISACVSNGQVAKAFEVFDMMKQSGNKKPDNRTYSSFVSGLCRCGKWEQATELVNEAFGLSGLPPTLPDKPIEADAIDQLLSLLAQKGLTDTVAVPLLDRMRAFKVPMSPGFYTTALQRAVNNPAGYGYGKGNNRQRNYY
jgi:pentatricopeptide repeat protein